MNYASDASTQSWLDEVWTRLDAKMSAECDRIGDRIPYIPENGRYMKDMGEVDPEWWTNGFWGGMLWQMYHATKQEKYKTAAEGVERRLDVTFENFEGLHHDVGFMWLHTSVANYRLTGDARAKARGLHAANILAGRYNPRGKFIRAWNQDRTGWMIVDCMMNIPILYWASELIGDPRFTYIAKDHADTTLNVTVRPDGSCNHIVVLDPDTGELLETPGGQGYESGSSWSRGQAWALYGFALSYRHTGDVRYLDAAKQIAHYFIANVAGTDYVPLVDFRSPAEGPYWDTTAGMIAACGLLEIADSVGELEQGLYANAALNMLKSTERQYANWDVEVDSIIANGTAAYHSRGHDFGVPIIYGDYFFIEAILRLRGQSFLIW